MNSKKKIKIGNWKFIFFILTGISSIIILTFIFNRKFSGSINSFTINESGLKIKVQLNRKAKNQYTLVASCYNKGRLIQSNSWPFAYEVFKLDTGDVNNDGATDILVGVIKRTRFDTVCRKRLFIFKLFEGYIRPLWLGSRVSQPLEDFKFYQNKLHGIVRTIELEQDMSYLVAEYHWQGFGLSFIHYLARELTFRQAQKILNTNQYETNR